jgi:hypothetical protein
MKFFRREPRAGMPIALAGLAEGLRKMALALERMEVANGHVEWTPLGAPRLHFDGGGNSTPNMAATGEGDISSNDWEEREDAVIDWRLNTSSERVEVKRGTILVKKDSETDWEYLDATEKFDA